ncbi:MAG: hypothetical protein WCQ41_05215 [Bacillota bacterium]
MDLKRFNIFDFNRKPTDIPLVDDPNAPAWKKFLKQFASKISQLLGINFLYLLFSIPSLVIAYFASFWIFGQSFDKYFGFSIEQNFIEMLVPRVVLGLVMILFPVVAVGPVHAGFTYVFRNFSRQKHAYVWWDFKDHALANMKQGIIVSLINLVIVFLLGLAINSYTRVAPEFTGTLSYAAVGFVSIAFAIFLSMNMYIYPLMVTYDMKIRELYKVAYSLAFMRLIPNLLLILGIVVVLFLAYGFLPIIGAILTLIILPATILFVINYFVDPVIRKLEETQEEIETSDTDNI